MFFLFTISWPVSFKAGIIGFLNCQHWCYIHDEWFVLQQTKLDSQDDLARAILGPFFRYYDLKNIICEVFSGILGGMRQSKILLEDEMFGV